jgi:hypothetical protein
MVLVTAAAPASSCGPAVPTPLEAADPAGTVVSAANAAVAAGCTPREDGGVDGGVPRGIPAAPLRCAGAGAAGSGDEEHSLQITRVPYVVATA